MPELLECEDAAADGRALRGASSHARYSEQQAMVEVVDGLFPSTRLQSLRNGRQEWPIGSTNSPENNTNS